MKWTCSEWRCGWHGDDEDILRSPDPFVTDGIITACPKCRTVESLVSGCDEPGCMDEGECGFPTPEGYRRTCYKHKPIKVGDRREGVSLDGYSNRELIEELLRRTEGGRAVRAWCETCQNYKTDPEASESYNPCQKGQKMQFQMPSHYGDEDWGFYRNRCKYRR